MGALQIIQLITMLLPVIEKDGPLVYQAIHDLIVAIEGSAKSNPAALATLKQSLLTAAQRGT